MRRELRTFAGAMYTDIWLYPARSKAEASERLFERLPAEWKRGTSARAMRRYVAPVFWCPRQERLWFHMSVTPRPRSFHPDYVPPDLWGGIESAEGEDGVYDFYDGGNPGGMTVMEADLSGRAAAHVGCAVLGAARRFAFDPALARANDGAALRIARGIDESGDYSAMPILGDALEEAGCTDPALLGHCRQPGAHVAGCWVAGLVLGRK